MNVRSEPKSMSCLNRFAWFTAFATLLLICSGGMVTSKGVGLAVPDWPTTFGYNMFLFPAAKWIGGIFFEHTHRLIASTVGLLTIILAAWLWLVDPRRWVRTLGLAAVGAVILQGVLGGLRVTMLKDEIGIFHACLAQAFFGLIVIIALVTSRSWRALASVAGRDKSLRVIALVTTAFIYLQLALGATMRHQHRDLAITDFPTAYGQWMPDTSAPAIAKINAARDTVGMSDVSAGQIWLQMTHRFGAVLVAIDVIWFFVSAHRNNISPLRGLSTAWLVGVLLQLTLGAWTIWSNKAADIATMHVAVGATMLGLGAVICAFCFRQNETSSAFSLSGQRKSDPVIA
ncbi:MAG: cytochrome oxidase biogenesis protein CtaA [Verrucomicrobia bacterium]|nr:MAG: cytochrome oxidase biogenesis protein CtaA [Verrucomicrobiota bacterium]